MTNLARVGSKKFEFFVADGIARGAQSISERTYSQGYSTLGGGTYLSSSLNESTRFFLQFSNGQEQHVILETVLPIRDGHRVKVLYCGTPKSGEGLPVAAHNEATGATSVTSSLAFQRQFQAIGQTNLGFRFVLALIVIVGGITLWLWPTLPLGGPTTPLGQKAGWAALFAFGYLMYEGLIGMHFYIANRLRGVQRDLLKVVKKMLPLRS
jgi:hypothetical protein